MSVSLILTFALAFPALLDEADDQYNFLVGLAEKGYHELVVKEASGFLEKYPDHQKANQARYRLGTALFDLDRIDDARPHFAALTKLTGFPFEDEVHFRFGQCELERDAFDAAAGAFEHVVDRGEGYLVTPATFLLAEALFRNGKFAEAEVRYEAVRQAEDKGDYEKDAGHGLVWCAYRLGRWDQTVERVNRYFEAWGRDERSSELSFLLGEAHFESGRSKEALAAYREVQAGPFHDAALRGAGFAAAALEDHAQAATWFGKLLADYPSSRFASEAALHHGIHLLKSGDARAADEALRNEAAGDGAETLYWRSRALAELGEHERAANTLALALEGAPTAELGVRIQVALGDALYELGRADEAAATFERAGTEYALHAASVLKLNGGDHAEAVRLARMVLAGGESAYRNQAQLTLAEGLFALEDYENAEPAFLDVLSSEGEDDDGRRVRALSRLGWCRYLQNDAAGAAARFREVAARYPDSDEASEALFMEGRANETAQDQSAATRAYRDYIERYPTGEHRAEALLRLARFHAGPEGNAYLQQLVEESPGSTSSAQAHYDLAERLAASGDFELAAEHYRALIDGFPTNELVPAATYGLAWAAYSGGDSARAVELLQELTGEEATTDAELRFVALELLVWAQRKAGNAQGALDAFQAFAKVCTDEPRTFRAAKVVGAALKDADRLADAEALYGPLAERSRDPGVRLGLSIERIYLALDLNRIDDAEATARAAHAQAPGDARLAEAFFFVGEALFEKDEDGRAADVYLVAAASAAPDVAVRANYKAGYARLRSGDNEGAASCFRAIVDGAVPTDLLGESLFLLGEALYRLEKYAEAVPPLKRVCAELPDHEVASKALFRLGVAEAKLERWTETEQALADLVNRFPDFPNNVEAELWRGRALAKLGQRRGARQALERVIERDRGLLAAQARIELGRLAYDASELDTALSEFLKVAILYAHEEEVAEAQFMAGQVLEKQGNAERAVDLYREIGAKYPQARFAEHAAERLEALGAN